MPGLHMIIGSKLMLLKSPVKKDTTTRPICPEKEEICMKLKEDYEFYATYCN